MSQSKCSVKNGRFVTPCRNLAEVTEGASPAAKRKGIFFWTLGNGSGPTRSFFGAKSGEHTQKGLLFNFCPFCGESIDAPFAEQPAPTTPTGDT